MEQQPTNIFGLAFMPVRKTAKKPAQKRKMKTAKKTVKNRERLETKLWDLIEEHGADLNVDEFADAIGVAREEMRSYFPCRADLYEQMVDSFDQKSKIWEILQVSLDQSDAIQQYYDFIDAMLSQGPKSYFLAVEFERIAPTNQKLLHAINRRVGRFLNVIRQLTQNLHDQNQLRSDWDVITASQYIMTQVSIEAYTHFISHHRWPEEMARQNIIHTGAYVILKNPQPIPASSFLSMPN